MEHICDKCIHCYKPVSIKDYFDKTMKMPDIHKWGVDVFKHLFWLCDTEPVSQKIHTNDSMLMKPCIEQNLHGNCESFRISDAEDIHPSSISIIPPTEIIRQGDEAVLEVIVTPCTIPAVTEKQTITVEEELVNENGGLILDDNNQPLYVKKEIVKDVIIVPEHENDQDISYKYQWYKNGRKLFQENKKTVSIDTSKASEDVYKCVVSQYIKNNGDGGNKFTEVSSNEVTINVIGVNKISMALKAGNDPTIIPLPFIPASIEVPFPLENGWSITNITFTDAAMLTKDVEARINCSDGIFAEIADGLEINGSSGTITIEWDRNDSN